MCEVIMDNQYNGFTLNSKCKILLSFKAPLTNNKFYIYTISYIDYSEAIVTLTWKSM